MAKKKKESDEVVLPHEAPKAEEVKAEPVAAKPVDVGAEIAKDIKKMQGKYALSAGGFNVKAGKIVFRAVLSSGVKVSGEVVA